MRALAVLKELNEGRRLLASAIDDGLDHSCVEEVRIEVDRLEAELDAIDARRGYSRRKAKL